MEDSSRESSVVAGDLPDDEGADRDGASTNVWVRRECAVADSPGSIQNRANGSAKMDRWASDAGKRSFWPAAGFVDTGLS